MQDISKSGLCLLVDEDELIDIMMNSSQFNCYIMIKGQAPIVVNCWIRMRRRLEDDSLKVGVKILGDNEHLEHMQRYWKYIELLEEKS